MADDRGAWLVRPDDLPNAIDRMRELLSDDTRLERLGAEAKDIVSNMTWANRAEKILAFMDARSR